MILQKERRIYMRKFGIRDQIGYIFGDIGGSMVNLYIDMFFLSFSTYVLGMDPKYMAIVFFLAKVWDAINDPLMGSLPDRFTIGKSGDKFKPYIKIAMFFLALSPILCFLNVSSWSMMAKYVWVPFVYIFYGMSYTGTSMPYGAMASVITDDPEERMKLSRARSLGAVTVGILFIPYVSMVIWNKDQTPNAFGYFELAIIAAVVCLISYMLLVNLTTERIKLTPKSSDAKSKENNYKFSEVLKGMLKNRPLLGLMIATVGGSFATLSTGGFAMYLYKEYYHAPRIMALSSIISLPVVFLCFFFVPKIGMKFGKKKVIMYGLAFSALFSLCLYLFPIANPYVFLVLNTIGGIGQTVFMILTWAMVTDCIDYQEYKTGQRADGTLYSIYTFSRKIGSSFSHSVATFVLGLIGFVSTVPVQADGVGDNIRDLVTIAPVFARVIQLIAMGLIYNLNKEKTDEMYKALKKDKKVA